MEKKELNPTDYWQQQMFHIIEMSHPYLFRDKELLEEIIINRSEEAYDQYLAMVKEGKEVIFAREEAREVLLEGYKWSPTDFLGSLYYGEFNKELEIEERVDLYFKYKFLFDEYSTTELFDNPDKEDELRMKLIERINNQEN